MFELLKVTLCAAKMEYCSKVIYKRKSKSFNNKRGFKYGNIGLKMNLKMFIRLFTSKVKAQQFAKNNIFNVPTPPPAVQKYIKFVRVYATLRTTFNRPIFYCSHLNLFVYLSVCLTILFSAFLFTHLN